jgi:nucleoside-diphosphate-sugar epimerase
MSTALVTGATGFLGQHLVRHLVASGREVHIVQRASSPRPVLADFRAAGVTVHEYEVGEQVQAIARTLAPETAFHLATFYLKDHQPSEVEPLIEANVVFGSHLLEGLVGTGAVVVSAMSYFQFRDTVPTPFSLYSATKQAFLDVSEFYRSGRGLDVRQVILYDTYGPGDTRDKLIPRLIGAVASGELVGMGSPHQPLNVLHSEDVARGFVAASASGAPALMALRAPENVSVAGIVDTIETVAGAPLSKSFNEAGAVNDLVDTAGTWPTPPGWAPRVSLEAGIRSILQP